MEEGFASAAALPVLGSGPVATLGTNGFGCPAASGATGAADRGVFAGVAKTGAAAGSLGI
ncbi:MAG: hypothetical protein HYY43_02830 [Deltaproteobacteria bacterium]|nr:hypothetical protein [Deltaproteobacteria bacterium]